MGEGEMAGRGGRSRLLRGAPGLAAALLSLVAAPDSVGQVAGVRRVVRECFEDNRRGWVEADDAAVRLAVAGGVYTMEFRRTSGYYVSCPPERVPTAGDLDIEAVVERSGGGDHGVGLVWYGRLDAPHSFQFLVLFGDGTYSLGSQREGRVSYVVQRELAAVLKAGGRTFLAVRRRGPITLFYANGTRLAVALSGTAFGDQVGLYVSRPSPVAVDSFEVSVSDSQPATPPSPRAAGPCGGRAPGTAPGGTAEAACRKVLDLLESTAVSRKASIEEAAALARGSAVRWADDPFLLVAASRAVVESAHLGGNVYDKAAVRSEAVPLVERALALAPDLPEALNARAEVLLALDEPGRANRALARSLEVAPGLWQTYLALGSYFDRTGRPAAAREAWSTGLTLARGSEEKGAVLLGMGRQLLRSGDRNEALEALGGSVALRPSGPNLLTDLGDLRREAGRPEEAMDAYRRALGVADLTEARRGLALAHADLASVRLGEERLDEALDEAREAVRLAGDVEGLQVQLGRVCERKGLVDEAIAAYEAAVDLAPRSLRARWGLARAWQGKAAALAGREAVLHRAVALAEYREALSVAPEPDQARALEKEIEELSRLGTDW